MRQTRKFLVNRVRELESRMGSAAGETRKGLRDRLARTSGELEEVKKQLRAKEGELLGAQKRVGELVEELQQLRPKQEPAKEANA